MACDEQALGATLTGLPEEILAGILSQSCISPTIESDETSAGCYTLYSVCLVSKAFNRIAEPLLYRTINLQRHGFDRLVRLLHGLVRRPELALHVRELRTASLDWEDAKRRIDRKSAGFVLLTRSLHQAVQTSPLPSELKSYLCHGFNDWMASTYCMFLLTMCANIASWTMSSMPYSTQTGTRLWQVVFEAQRLGKSSPGFPLHQLREITLGNDHEHRGHEAGDLNWQLLLPSVRMLKVYKMNMGFPIFVSLWDHASPWRYSTQCPLQLHQLAEIENKAKNTTIAGLLHLDLPYAEISADGVEKLFSFYRRLESLKILRASVTNTDPVHERELHRGPETNYRQIGKVLSTQGTGLTKLHLHIQHETSLEPEKVEWGLPHRNPPIGCLQALNHLRELSIQKVMLTGRAMYLEGQPEMSTSCLENVLPLSLRVLEVLSLNRMEDPAFDEQFLALSTDPRYTELRVLRMNSVPSPELLARSLERTQDWSCTIKPATEEDGDSQWIELKRQRWGRT